MDRDRGPPGLCFLDLPGCRVCREEHARHEHNLGVPVGEGGRVGFGVVLGQCSPAHWTDHYTCQVLHVWVVPYPGGPFSDDLSRAATNAAARAALAQN